MKLRCLIVDDEPVARKLLREYIEDIPFLELAGEAENPLKVQDILDHESVDLIFLDVNMPKISGLQFLRSSYDLPMVILTTAYTEHALDGYNLDVLDYLVKPFSFERFLKGCNKAKDYQTLKLQAAKTNGINEPYFFVKCNGRIEKILYDELLYIEASLNYVTLHTTARGKIIVYLTIKGIMDSLPGDIFLKVHKSFIINLQKISSIEGNVIHIGKAEIPISQNSHDEIMKKIFSVWSLVSRNLAYNLNPSTVGLLFAAAIFTQRVTLSFLVVAVFAELILYKNIFFVNVGKFSKFCLAFLFFDKAFSKSSGN
jgi:two-component system, LytTR family, response regulator